MAEDKKKKSKPKKRNLFGILSGGKTPEEQREWARQQPKPKLGVHEALDLLGSIPLAGEPADLLNAFLYASKGKKGDAMLSLLASTPMLGTMIPVFRGTKLNLKAQDVVGFQDELGAIMQGGGGYRGFQKGMNRPYWSTLEGAIGEAASYPRDIGIQRLSSGHFGRDRALWEVETTVDAIRKYAQGMRGFDPSDFPNFGVYQPLYTDAFGMGVNRMGRNLHTIFERGLPISEIKRVKLYEDVRFPRDPRQYYDYKQSFLEPILGKGQDVTDWIKRYARDTQR